jgi:ferredoxin
VIPGQGGHDEASGNLTVPAAKAQLQNLFGCRSLYPLAICGGRPHKILQHRLNVMADIANKYPESVPGKYYVDNQCIDCDLCRETAPNNFTRNEDGGYSYVCKQPESPEEEAQCKEAKEGCPVEAIGDNG